MMNIRRFLLALAIVTALIPPVVLGVGVVWLVNHADNIGENANQIGKKVNETPVNPPK